jgi:hypothetical protein
MVDLMVEELMAHSSAGLDRGGGIRRLATRFGSTFADVGDQGRLFQQALADIFYRVAVHKTPSSDQKI